MERSDDWGIDKLIKEGGVIIMEPKELTKKEQLRSAFKNILEDWGFRGSDIDNVTYLLLKEVKDRVKL